MEIRSPTQRLTSLVCALLLLASSVGVAQAQTPTPTQSGAEALNYDEAEAQAIDRMIICPVCPAETIDQAQVPLARQMRRTVREMLSQGATRQEILDFFAQRYGPDILASPPKSGFNLVAWIFPVVGVAAALLAGVLVLRSMAARKSGGPVTVPSMPPGEDLRPYLEMVDRELSLGHSPAGDENENTSGPTTEGVESHRRETRNDG